MGFTGELIVEKDDNFVVIPTCELFTNAEKEQINRIVPLGWYHNKLSEFAKEYEISWKIRANEGQRLESEQSTYRCSTALGVSDLLKEYRQDICFLEKVISFDGPIALSYIHQHLQIYLLVMPTIYDICVDIVSRDIRGCQILDYLSNVNVESQS